MTTSQIIAALNPPALAFKRAQDKGYVWLGEQGTLETCEAWLCPPEPRVLNPDQLTIEGSI